jgi:hypothetical protein
VFSTGPRIKADDVNPLCGLDLTCKEEKYVECYIIMCDKKMQNPYLGWQLSVKDVNLTPLWSLTAPFPANYKLPPSPQTLPFFSPT